MAGSRIPQSSDLQPRPWLREQHGILGPSHGEEIPRGCHPLGKRCKENSKLPSMTDEVASRQRVSGPAQSTVSLWQILGYMAWQAGHCRPLGTSLAGGTGGNRADVVNGVDLSGAAWGQD